MLMILWRIQIQEFTHQSSTVQRQEFNMTKCKYNRMKAENIHMNIFDMHDMNGQDHVNHVLILVNIQTLLK